MLRRSATRRVAPLLLALCASAGGLDARAVAARSVGHPSAGPHTLARATHSRRSLVLGAAERGGSATLAPASAGEQGMGGRVGRAVVSGTGWTSFYGGRGYAASTKDITPGSEAMQWYLRAIGRDKLLDREKEIILASRIRILLDWEGRRLQEEEMLDRKISVEEWAEVIGACSPRRMPRFTAAKASGLRAARPAAPRAEARERASARARTHARTHRPRHAI